MTFQRFVVLIIGFFALFCSSACRKDPSIVITDPSDTICESCDSCKLYPDYQGWMLGFDILEDSVQWRMPYFNPNNPDEILYVKENNANVQMTINTFNLITEEHHVIYTGSNSGASQIYSAPRWGINDWLIFTRGDENAYKIKSDGTDLTQLTLSGQYHSPIFNEASDRFLIRHESSSFKSYILDLDGNFLDSIDYAAWEMSTWNYGDYLVTLSGEHIRVIDVSENTLVSTYQSPISGEFSNAGGGVMWVDNSTVLWSVFPYLFKSDISFSNVVKAKKVCDRNFIRGSINADKTKIVWETYSYTYVDPQHLHLKMRIVLMNPTTLEFEPLDLP